MLTSEERRNSDTAHFGQHNSVTGTSGIKLAAVLEESLETEQAALEEESRLLRSLEKKID